MPPLKRKEVELRIEREAVRASGGAYRISLAVRFDVLANGKSPSPEELGDAVRDLLPELEEAAVRGGLAVQPVRSERALSELVETYRPRRSGLIDALEADGELTLREATLLRGHLTAAGGPTGATSGPPLPPPTDRPLAAMPISVDRTPSSTRSIPELLKLFSIETLKHAGAVRARRQISFDEYMSLKRHFAALLSRPEPGEPPQPDSRPA